jgi:hypothetical protein
MRMTTGPIEAGSVQWGGGGAVRCETGNRRFILGNRPLDRRDDNKTRVDRVAPQLLLPPLDTVWR